MSTRILAPLVVLMLLPAAALAQDVAGFEPNSPSAGQAFRAFVEISLGGANVLAGEPQVSVEGSTVRIGWPFRPIVIGPPLTLFYGAEVPPLAPGQYEVRFELFQEDDPSITIPLTVRQLTVERRVFVRVLRDGPSLDETLAVEISNPVECGAIDGDVAVEGDEVRVPYVSMPCPDGQSPTSVTTPVFGPLPAGDYSVVVSRRPDLPAIGDNLRWREPFTVLPFPAVQQPHDRFEIEVTWRDFEGGEGRAFPVLPQDDGTTLFWFFDEERWELFVKVLDGCVINGHHWVFGAATTNVEYTVVVRDRQTGAEVIYHNPLGQSSPAITDTLALACG